MTKLNLPKCCAIRRSTCSYPRVSSPPSLSNVPQTIDRCSRHQHRGHAAAHRIDDCKFETVVVQRVVEGIAADRVGRLQDSGNCDVGRRCGEWWQQIPLDLGRRRQRYGPSTAQPCVGVPALGDQQRHHDGYDRRQNRRNVVPDVEVEFQHSDSLGAIDQGNADDRRVFSACDRDTVCKDPTCDRALDHHRLPDGTVRSEFSQREQPVVGDKQSASPARRRSRRRRRRSWRSTRVEGCSRPRAA